MLYTNTTILRSISVILVFMSRRKIQDINKNERLEIVGNLFDIVTNLKTKKETIGFLMGLVSPSEMLMLARRIQVAQKLLEDKSYKDISSEMNVGEGTVSSVARWLYDENNQIFKKQIKSHLSKNKRVKTKQHYSDILSPYGQLKILKDIINNKM